MVYDGVRVVVVADNDAEADPRIPKDVLAALTPTTVLTNGTMMYMRVSLWKKCRDYFPVLTAFSSAANPDR